MMKKIIILIALLIVVYKVNAQSGILTINPKATLHIGNTISSMPDGIIAPRLTKGQLIDKEAMYTIVESGTIVYVTDLIDNRSTFQSMYLDQIGYYYYDGSTWRRMEDKLKYFYLPQFSLPLSAIQNGNTFDLFNEVYLKQLTLSSPALPNNFINSNSITTTTMNKIYTPLELDYIVTYYDTEVISITNISTQGVITYDILSEKTGPSSFINVVLLVK